MGVQCRDFDIYGYFDRLIFFFLNSFFSRKLLVNLTLGKLFLYDLYNNKWSIISNMNSRKCGGHFLFRLTKRISIDKSDHKYPVMSMKIAHAKEFIWNYRPDAWFLLIVWITKVSKHIINECVWFLKTKFWIEYWWIWHFYFCSATLMQPLSFFWLNLKILITPSTMNLIRISLQFHRFHSLKNRNKLLLPRNEFTQTNEHQ